MKNTLLAILLLATGEFALAQGRHQAPPTRVRQSFQRDFPGASDTRWSQSGNQWHANFTDRSPEDRGEMVAYYDGNGRHIDSHIPYAQQDVPQPVYSSARKRYHDDRMEFTRVEHPTRGDYFEVRARVHGKIRTSYYDENGHERHYYNRH
ncbi:MAG TPA: hypothetical protein VHE54_16935 [Puia sp.]|nr:hypothetical protein [Puia sp.]